MPRLGWVLTVGALTLMAAPTGNAWADVVANGISHNGISHNGISHNGISHNSSGQASIPNVAIVAVILPDAPAR